MVLGKHNQPGQVVSIRETTLNNLFAKGTTRKSSNSEYNSSSNAGMGKGLARASMGEED